MMQLQPEDPNEEFRTILKKTGKSVTHQTSKASRWVWNTLKALKKAEQGAIGFIRRRKDGLLELQVSETLDKADLAAALLDHVGVDIGKLDPTIWQHIPDAVLKRVSQNLDTGSQRVAQEWNAKREDGLTGTLFNTIKLTRVGAWEFRLSPVEFSSSAKENHAGADVALLMHARDANGNSAIKTLWFQAKKDERQRGNLDGLADLPDQLAKMRKVTPHSFPLLYSRHGVVVANRLRSPTRTALKDFIVETLKCQHGDARPEVFADSIDKTRIFELVIQKQPKKPKPAPPQKPAQGQASIRKTAVGRGRKP